MAGSIGSIKGLRGCEGGTAHVRVHLQLHVQRGRTVRCGTMAFGSESDQARQIVAAARQGGWEGDLQNVSTGLCGMKCESHVCGSLREGTKWSSSRVDGWSTPSKRVAGLHLSSAEDRS
eukprot:359549-Chlamydomonas_euryale.AAC.1